MVPPAFYIASGNTRGGRHWFNHPLVNLASEGLVVGPKGVFKRLQVLGHLGLEQHFFLRHRMLEAEFGGMKSLPAEAADDVRKFLWQAIDLGGIARGIDLIGDQRM